MNNLKFKIEGMTCAACQGVIETETRKLSGIKNVQVNFATESGEFEVEKDFDLENLHALLSKLGYRAIDPNQVKESETSSAFNKDFYKALFAFILASFVMFFAMVVMNNPIQLVLTTIMLIFFGAPYVKAVVSFKSNMNTLIGLGVLSSYFYSIFLMMNDHHAHTYFEGGAFIIAFTLIGHYLDGLAKTKARGNLSSLYKMQVKFASKINGTEIENVPVVDLVKGDLIRIKPGEKIPLDGIIKQGSTHTNESMLTGESEAITKDIGSKVFAGSINLEGSFTMEIESNLHSTFISEIVNFVEKAQLKKAPIQKYADKIVSYFVPVIVVIAIITFVVWYLLTKDLSVAMIHMVSVFVIACPCALGLAVPMAIMLSTSEAAKSGLLINGGDVVEKGAHIDSIIFDKTGTLTEGNPQLTQIYLFDTSWNETDALVVAASCVQYSTHPLSKSIADFALSKKHKLNDPDKFQNLVGLGVSAQLNGKNIALGNAELIKQSGSVELITEQFYAENVGSYVFMAIDGKLIAAFIITDPIKKEAAAMIKSLHEQKIEVWMVTGDHPGIAYKVGETLGIPKEFIKASTKPVGKADFLHELQAQGKKVAMIGDGINDAPALSKANLSMAMSNGSDIALEASEVSILEGNIALVAEFFLRSKRTMRIIKENLILSSVYNLLCIPLAAGVFYPFFKVTLTPMWASLAMALSSFSVIINSFRVKKL